MEKGLNHKSISRKYQTSNVYSPNYGEARNKNSSIVHGTLPPSKLDGHYNYNSVF